jgi:hypothetical protein
VTFAKSGYAKCSAMNEHSAAVRAQVSLLKIEHSDFLMRMKRIRHHLIMTNKDVPLKKYTQYTESMEQ